MRAPASVVKESDIPNFANINTIGCFAFTSTNLKSFVCTSNLRSLDIFSFHVTSNAEIIDLSRGRFKVIPMRCFCFTNVSEIILPKTVTKICDASFATMPKLRAIVLYRKINIIEKNVFLECPQLKLIYYSGKTDFSNAGCFETIMNITVFVSYNYRGKTFCNVAVNKILVNDEIATCHYQRALLKQRNYILSLVFIVSY